MRELDESRRGSPAAAARARILLACGAGLGLLIAAVSLLRDEEQATRPLAPELVARVNGVPIYREEYERVLAALAAERDAQPSAGDRKAVLERLIDEALLVEHGVALGLPRVDRSIRASLIAAVISAETANRDGPEPTAEELRAFYRKNAELFRAAERLRVRSIYVEGPPRRSADEARERARRAGYRLREGEDYRSVQREYGDPNVLAIPSSPLTPVKLREYIGPTLLAEVRELQAGEVSAPHASGSGFVVIQLLRRSALREPELAEIEPQVRAEMQRRAGDRALRQALSRLRDGAQIQRLESP